MSKTVKNMLTRDYTKRLEGFSEALVISIRGMKATQTTKLRRQLSKNKIKITVVRNDLARKAFKGSALESLDSFLSGASALAYGGGSIVEVAREITGMLADYPGLELKGAILDGTLFKGDAGVKELSKYPTRPEAIGNVVTLLVSPGRKLAAQVKGPGSNIAGIIKAIEAKLEKGEAISKK
ncbi:MAG: 50S ribosomal protein L10 [bacterium]|jgi:large subunit ribosomal protein L10|nr:50S ribosomal protein L10 [Phycisphaerales bacterium]MCE2653092.1 50S ribosomal protein L10 [Planctomycetaceae bacterium]